MASSSRCTVTGKALCWMSEDTYKKLQGDNKQLLIVPGAVHTDLYDNLEKIPFDQIEAFFRGYLK